jgi:NADH:ubiquinone oxidoreductase subunit 4 (subunit M)
MSNYDIGLVNLMLVDNYSFFLIFLSILISFLMVFARDYIYRKNLNFFEFGGLCFIILLFLILSFGCGDLFFFYVFFESSLIPIFLMIMG